MKLTLECDISNTQNTGVEETKPVLSDGKISSSRFQGREKYFPLE